jgi:acetyl esterase/lipase
VRKLLVIGAVALLVGSAVPAHASSKHNLTYKRLHGLRLKLDVRMPRGPGPFPGIVLIHGGKHITGDKCQSKLVKVAKQFVDLGFVVYTPNYRLAPSLRTVRSRVRCRSGPLKDVSGLQGHHFPAATRDVADAIRWIKDNARDYKTLPHRLAAVGASAGGTEALIAGDKGLVDAAVGWSGATFFDPSWGHIAEHKNYFGCGYQVCRQRWRRASPLSRIRRTTAPTAIFNSRHEVIPRSQATLYARALARNEIPVRKSLILGHLHALAYRNVVLGSGRTVLEATARFIKRH